MKAGYHGMVLFYTVLAFVFGIFELNPKYAFVGQNRTRTNKTMNLNDYYENMNWTVNGNVSQYSSYVIVNTNRSRYSIQSMFRVSFSEYNKDDFVCMLHFININKTLQLKPSELFVLDFKGSLKIICEHDGNKKLDFDNVLVAIVSKHDFETPRKAHIHFQLPGKLYENETSRMNGVALCVPYVEGHSSESGGIHSWLDMHRRFGVLKIVLYDATDDSRLASVLANDSSKEDYVEVRPYRGHEMSEITSNDCFTVLSLAYEFVAVYNLNEYIFPRNLIRDGRELSKCDDFKRVCESKPFSISIYEYIQKIIQDNNKTSRHELHSIQFKQAIYLYPNYIEKQLFIDLKDLIQQYDNNSRRQQKGVNPTIKLVLTEPAFSFSIDSTNINHAKMLLKMHESFSCLYKTYLKSGMMNKRFDSMRHLYIIENRSASKCIYYSKNVKVISPHEVNEKTLKILANAFNGHLVSVFQNNFFSNLTSSISHVNFDSEYIFHLLVNNSDFCLL